MDDNDNHIEEATTSAPSSTSYVDAASSEGAAADMASDTTEFVATSAALELAPSQPSPAPCLETIDDSQEPSPPTFAEEVDPSKETSQTVPSISGLEQINDDGLEAGPSLVLIPQASTMEDSKEAGIENVDDDSSGDNMLSPPVPPGAVTMKGSVEDNAKVKATPAVTSSENLIEGGIQLGNMSDNHAPLHSAELGGGKISVDVKEPTSNNDDQEEPTVSPPLGEAPTTNNMNPDIVDDPPANTGITNNIDNVAVEVDTSIGSQVPVVSENQENSETVPHIPNAYLVEEGGGEEPGPEIIDAYAEPVMPWWKQKRTRVLLAIIAALVILVAMVLIFSTRSSDGAGTATNTEVIESSSSPSLSLVPTEEPSSHPTTSPSSSTLPSSSPTSCIYQVSNSKMQTLELPLNDPVGPVIRVDGKTAVVVARESTSDQIYITFFSFDDVSEQWVRKEVFVETYADPDLEDIYNFYVALKGSTFMLGLPLMETEAGSDAGLVFIYERNENSLDLWEKVAEPLVPDEPRPGAYFGYLVNFQDSIAVVGSFHEKALYLFQKNSNNIWIQLSKREVEYNPYGVFLAGDSTIISIDLKIPSIYLYEYDPVSSSVSTLQEPIVLNPDLEKHDGLAGQVSATGTGYQFANIRVSNDYFLYTLASFEGDDFVVNGVFLYRRQKDDSTFALHQYFNSSEYEEGFGWNLATGGNDLLLIGGNNSTYIFSEHGNGTFVETSNLEGSYNAIRLSGRSIIAVATANEEVVALNIEDCTHPVPTQLPSSSAAPIITSTALPSLSPTMSQYPTTSIPTLSHRPSSGPSSSVAPSISVNPSISPSSSTAPTICYDVGIAIYAGANTGTVEGGVTTWEFYEKQAGTVLASGGPLAPGQAYEYIIPCLPVGVYEINVTDSAGDGFGDCGDALCGYYILVDGNLIGGSGSFGNNEVFTFPLPVVGDVLCAFDFTFGIVTDDFPERYSWTLVNEEGETVVNGGPYQIQGAYTQRACLYDGKYTFTMINSQWANIEAPNSVSVGGYYVYANGLEVVIDFAPLDFGIPETASFISGPVPDLSPTASSASVTTSSPSST